MADTTNFSWTKPVVLGSSGAWGTILNAALDDIDTDLQAVKTTADAALPASGGSLSGEVDILTARYNPTALGGSLSGGVVLDLDTGNFFHGTMDGSIVISFSNVPASPDFVAIVLKITGSGNNISWPSSVAWPGGSAPTTPASGNVNVYTLFTHDGGTTWYGTLAMEDLS